MRAAVMLLQPCFSWRLLYESAMQKHVLMTKPIGCYQIRWLKCHIYKQIHELDFTSAKSQKSKFDDKIDQSCSNNSDPPSQKSSYKKEKVIPKPSKGELQSFFTNLSKCNSKPALLSIVQPFSDNYIPQQSAKELPPLLTELTDPSAFGLPFNELLQTCSKVKAKIKVTSEKSKTAEREARDQSSNKKCFLLRGGRITASKSKDAIRTDPSQPSQSLIKTICYPDAYKVSNIATCWGCNHEKEARELYAKVMTTKHNNFQVRDCCLVI